MREITFDTETTGFDPKSGHRIVEIGCVELIDRKRTGKVFHAYVNPERDMPKSAEEIHGLSEEFLADKPVFAQVAKDFMAFVGKDKLVIHNAAFDMKFINFELEKAGHEWLAWEQAIDTLDIARRKFPGAKATLDALCTRFGISLEKRDKHGALLDAELLADVYIEMVEGSKQSALILEEERQAQQNNAPIKNIRNYYEARSFLPSKEELEAHRQFIEKLKDPMWMLN